MTEIIKSSLVYRFFASIGRWFGGHWESSRIVSAFLDVNEETVLTGKSGWYRLIGKIRALWTAVFRKLHLNTLFRDSIFADSFPWVLLAVALAPLLPTMVVLALVMVEIF